MKNADLKEMMRFYGIERTEVASYLKIPMKDFTRRINKKQVSKVFRAHILYALKKISERSND